MKKAVLIFAVMPFILALACVSCSNGADGGGSNPAATTPSSGGTGGTNEGAQTGGTENPSSGTETPNPTNPTTPTTPTDPSSGENQGGNEQTDTTPPACVQNVTANIGNSTILLSWTNPNDSDFAKTKITFLPTADSVTQPIDVAGQPGQSSSADIAGLLNGTEYTFYLTAMDANGNCSTIVEIKATPQMPADTTPPAEATSLAFSAKHKRIELTWLNPTDTDFYATAITFTPEATGVSQPIVVQGTAGATCNKTIENLENGIEYTFTLKSIDSSNNKSSGKTISASPVESVLRLTTVLPNDSGNIIFTKDSAPIRVTVASSNTITKAVWKKGQQNILPTATGLLNDASATSFVINSMQTVNFDVTENGVYDFAVQNDEGICDIKQVEVKTIDNTPPAEVIGLSVDFDGTKINLNWTNPVVQSVYDSPLSKVKVTYIYNDDSADASNGSIEYTSTKTSCSINLPNGKGENDFARIKIQTIDALGNTSSGTQKKQWCCYCIIYPSDYGKIKSLTKNARVIFTRFGDYEISIFNDECTNLRKNSLGKSRRIDIDLSNIENLINIPESAFSSNLSLRSVSLPETVENIYDKAFSYCTNLTSIKFSETVKTIGNDAFSNCTNLTTIKLPESVTTIGSRAFSYCKNLISINIPVAVNKIGDSAFRACEKIETIDIPGEIYEMRGSEFHDCINLKTVNINRVNSPNGLWAYTFSGCKNLTSVTLGYVLYIGNFAFKDCESLKNIVLPDSCRRIEQESFLRCTNLEKVTFGNSIDSICRLAFNNCSNLTSVVFKNTTKKWFQTSNAINEYTKASELKGTSIGYKFSIDAQQNAKYLTDDYIEKFLYTDDFKPLVTTRY